MNELIRKAFGTSVQKTFGADRIIRLRGTTEARDRDNEVITFKGWDFTAFDDNPAFMWVHDYTLLPLGTIVDVIPRPRLKAWDFDAKFAKPTANPFAEFAYQSYLDGDLRMSSVGFEPKWNEKDAWIEGDVEKGEPAVTWLLKALIELSGCPIGSQPESLAQRIAKNVDTGELRELYRKMVGMDYARKVQIVVPRDITDPHERLTKIVEQLKDDDKLKASARRNSQAAESIIQKQNQEGYFTDKKEFDRVGAVLQERYELTGQPFGIYLKLPKGEIITKPETTNDYHRVPVPAEEGKHKGHRIRTIDIDKGKGIKALYCGECKVNVTYLFDVDKWSMADAKKWVKEHKALVETEIQTKLKEIMDILVVRDEEIGLIWEELKSQSDKIEKVLDSEAAHLTEQGNEPTDASEKADETGTEPGEERITVARDILARLRAMSDSPSMSSKEKRDILQALSDAAKQMRGR